MADGKRDRVRVGNGNERGDGNGAADRIPLRSYVRRWILPSRGAGAGWLLLRTRRNMAGAGRPRAQHGWESWRHGGNWHRGSALGVSFDPIRGNLALPGARDLAGAVSL